MYTIANLVPLVESKLRGRKDLSSYGGSPGSDIPTWVYQAILDLTPNFPFEELIVPGKMTNFQVGLAEYDISYFLQEGAQFTNVRSFFRYFSTDNPPLLGQTGNILKSRAPTVVEPMAVIPGLPTFWCQNNFKLLFGFNPDQAYTVRMRYQRPHPFNLADLLGNTVYMPDDWKEVLAYAAAIKGCEYIGMNAVSVEYFQKLHGDPKKPGNIGLLAEKASQFQRNMTLNERQLQPVVRRYT